MNPLPLFRRLLRKKRLESDMAAEMEQHVEMLAERHRAAGQSAAEARHAALREFGNIASVQERVREQRGWPWLENRWRDTALAARRLWQRPGFTLVALATLALGCGANTAIYSIVRGVVLRPLPFAEPERLVLVRETTPHNGGQPFTVSVPNFTDWRARSRSFESLVAVSERNANLTGTGEPAQVAVRFVSHGYRALLGVPPLAGRDFRESEDRPGANRVVVLGEDFWRSRFGADPAVIGRSLQLDGVAHEIVGVAAREPSGGGAADLFAPLGADLAKEERDNHEIFVFGRLRAGVSMAEAQAELGAVAEQLGREHPQSNAGWGVSLLSLHDALVPATVRTALYVLLGAVGLLLLNACVNLASMHLARSVVRERELAVCAALGGSRGRLVAQLLTESLMLALAGGALGVLLAHGLVDAWQASWLAAGVPRAEAVRVDAGVLAAALATSVLVGLLSGLGPAWRANRLDVRTALQSSGRGGSGRQRALRALVVAQVALSFCLLGASGLLLRSWGKLTRAELGFSPDKVLTMKFAPVSNAEGFYDRLLARVRVLPGVEAAGLASGVPLESFNTSMNVVPLGPSRLAPGKSAQAEWRLVRDDFFGTMRIPLRSGRGFTPADGGKSPKVVVLNETLARLLWGAENPIGKQIDIGGDGGEPATVVGLVGDVRSRHPGRPPEPAFYISGYRWVWGHMTLVLRTNSDPEQLMPLIRAEVKALDPALPIFGVRTMEAQVEASLGQSRMLATLVGGFGVLATALAALGVAGVTSFTVGMRTREIGVRLALGAQREEVSGLIQSENARLAGLGVLLGGGALVAGGRWLEGELHGVGAVDPVSLGGALLVVAAAVWLAAWWPARRAAKVDPMIALRAE